VKRHIRLAAAALCVAPLATGGVAAAAAKKSTKVKPTTVYCRTNVGVMIPAGATDITPPALQGTEYGSASCGKLGDGAQADKFTVPGSGDTLAKFTWYLPTGTLTGTYDLTPQEGSLGTGFASVSYLGTLKVTHGTGTLAGVTGVGTMTCSSPDSIHTSCTDKLELTSKTGVL
jgi:hypothetical protein